MSDSEHSDSQSGIHSQVGFKQNESQRPEDGDPNMENVDPGKKKKKRSKTKEKTRKDKKSKKSRSKSTKGGKFRPRLLIGLLLLFMILYLMPDDEAGTTNESSPESEQSHENVYKNQNEDISGNNQQFYDEAEMEEKYAKHFQHHCPVDWESPRSVLEFRGFSFFDNDDYYTGTLFCTSDKDLCDAVPVQSASCIRIDCSNLDADKAKICSQNSIPYECKFSSHAGVIQTEGGSYTITPVGYKCKVLNGKFCPPCQLSYAVHSTSIFGFSNIVRNTVAIFLVVTSVALFLKQRMAGKTNSEKNTRYVSYEDEYKYKDDDEDDDDDEQHSEDEKYHKEMLRKKKLLKAKLKAAALIKKMAKKEAAKRNSKSPINQKSDSKATNENAKAASRSRKSNSRNSTSRNSPSNAGKRESTRLEQSRKHVSDMSASSALSTDESFEMVTRKDESRSNSKQNLIEESSMYSDESHSD